jgi:hypothetical protein
MLSTSPMKFSVENSDHFAFFAAFVCRWRRAPQADVAHLVVEFGGVAPAFCDFIYCDQIFRFAGVLVCEFLCVGEESNYMADEFFGLLQPWLWQRSRGELFLRRKRLAQADSLTPA